MKKLILFLATTSIIFASDAQTLVEQNGCMSCHNVMGKKDAPAFMGVVRKNIRFYGDDAREHIVNSIKNGSSGKYPKFSDTAMPPFPNLNDEELDTIASWLFYEYDKNKSKMKSHGKGQGQGKGQGRGRGMNNMSW